MESIDIARNQHRHGDCNFFGEGFERIEAMTLTLEQRDQLATAPGFMKANVFHGPGHLKLEEKPITIPGYGEEVIKDCLTTN